jgi:hypothetical protein
VASLVKLAPVAARVLRHVASAQAALSAPPPAPPSRRSHRAFALVAHASFLVSVPISVAFAFGLAALGSGTAWVAWTKLGLGLVLVVEGWVLAKDWRGARRLTVWRLVHRSDARRPADVSLRGQLVRRLASPGLMVLGGVWLAVGVLGAALGLSQLV